MKAVRGGGSETTGKEFVKEVGLSRQRKREGIMDEQSGESEEKEVTDEGMSELEIEKNWYQNKVDEEIEFILETR